MTTGESLIAAERTRQIEQEGWTPDHDRDHGGSALLRAAECYEDGWPNDWPWDAKWWKPKGALRNLVRAGALYQASADLSPEFQGAAKAGVLRCAAKIDALLAEVAALVNAPAEDDETPETEEQPNADA